MDSHSSGKVFLVGAGPGAIDLITMRGAEILGRAQVVIYDSLVNPGLLRFAPASAELIHAGKRGGTHKDLEQVDINAMLIAHARKGMAVVRLKGGDPFIFGRGGEEAEALAAAGIGFEVVPGVTSAIAAPAFAGIPLTHREHGSFVAFVTGHEDENKGATSVPWDDLARAANPRGTLVILMATARLRGVLKRLEDAGLPVATPAAAIQWGTVANQKTVASTLASLADDVDAAKLGAPALVVVGQCADLREHLMWAERMPLFGRRIVITRASEKVSSFARELRALGAEVIEFPTIETVTPDSYATLDASIARIDAFDWIIFTSATGVEAFIERMKTLQKDIRAMGGAPRGYWSRDRRGAQRIRAHRRRDAAGISRRGHRGCDRRGEDSRSAHPDSSGAGGARSSAEAVAGKRRGRGGRRAGLQNCRSVRRRARQDARGAIREWP